MFESTLISPTRIRHPNLIVKLNIQSSVEKREYSYCTTNFQETRFGSLDQNVNLTTHHRRHHTNGRQSIHFSPTLNTENAELSIKPKQPKHI